MIRRLALPLLAATVLAACGGGDDSTADTAAPTVAPAAGTEAPPANTGNGALQFAAPLVGGGTIDLAELGDKPVLLWFWAPW